MEVVRRILEGQRSYRTYQGTHRRRSSLAYMRMRFCSACMPEPTLDRVLAPGFACLNLRRNPRLSPSLVFLNALGRFNQLYQEIVR